MVDVINSSQIVADAAIVSSDVATTLGDVFSPIMGILQAIGVVVLIYVVFLIIKGVMGMRTVSNISKISKNVEEINAKLDKLIKKPRAR